MTYCLKIDQFFSCFFSPDGVKIRSKPHLARYLGENIDLSAFDFRTGKIISNSLRKTKRHKGSSYDYSRGLCCMLLQKFWTTVSDIPKIYSIVSSKLCCMVICIR